MKVFAVIAPTPNPALDRVIAERFAGNFFPIAAGQFLVAVPGLTAKEVGTAIGDKGEVGQILILPFEDRWGFHRKDMWDWAQARAQA